MAKKSKSKKSIGKKATKPSKKKIGAKKSVKKAVKKKVVKKSAKKVAKKQVKKIKKKKVVAKKNIAKKTTSTKKKVVARKITPPIVKSQSTPAPSSEKFIPHVTSLQVGMAAPYFEGIDQHGNKITSADLFNFKSVIYFYPKDDTPGCTKEACNLRDNYQHLIDKGYKIIGVSPDNIASHKKFAEKYHLPFSLIADENKNIVRAFDVWGKKNMMGNIYEGVIRTTFVLDQEGDIAEIITKVDVENHAKQIMQE